MAGVLDKAKAHFDGRKGQRVEVPEWDCTLLVNPPTLKKIRHLSGFSEEVMRAKLLMEHATLEDGTAVFGDAAEPEVIVAVSQGLCPIVTTRIVNAISGNTGNDPVREAGNGSAGTPS